MHFADRESVVKGWLFCYSLDVHKDGGNWSLYLHHKAYVKGFIKMKRWQRATLYGGEQLNEVAKPQFAPNIV